VEGDVIHIDKDVHSYIYIYIYGVVCPYVHLYVRTYLTGMHMYMSYVHYDMICMHMHMYERTTLFAEVDMHMNIHTYDMYVYHMFI